MKKIPTYTALAFCGLFLVGCGAENPSLADRMALDDSGEDQFTLASCYETCEIYSGDDSIVSACRATCDANLAEENGGYVADNAIVTDESDVWPSDMPSAVPVFTHGDITESTDGFGGMWIVSFENADTDTLEKYRDDLILAGWDAKAYSMTNTMSGELAGQYNLSLLFDPEYLSGQIMVTKQQ